MYYNQPFGHSEYPIPSNYRAFQSPQNRQTYISQSYRTPQLKIDDKVPELIEEAAKREKKMICYDKKIMEGLESDVDKKRVLRISFNQIKHEKMFGEIYQGMTGRKLLLNMKDLRLSENTKTIIEDRIFQGFESIEFYRKIYFLLLPVEWKQMMYEIIGDEQDDIIKYIYYRYK